MRLIDADALRERMYHDAFETDSPLQKWDSGCWIRYKMFENAIEDMPTIEAEPVRRGRWERTGGSPWFVRTCSECGSQWLHSETWPMPNYCSNCGARMEEDE